MKKQWIKCPQIVLLILILLISGVLSPVTRVAAANPGLRVSGALLVTDVSAGETLTHQMVVGIGDSDVPVDIIIQIGDIGQALDGGFQILSPSANSSQFSASGYITVDKDSFHLKPGTSQEINLTIRIPLDAATGGKYALVNVRTLPTGQSSVGMISAVNVPIYLTIENSTLVHTGKITRLTSSEAVSGKPVEISTLFQNTGNHHFKVIGQVSVSDNGGKQMDIIDLPVSGSSLLPGLARELKATYTPQGELPPGTYNVNSRVMLEDGTVLDETAGQFVIKIPYIPPAPPANITLMPSSAATLQTDDSRISIIFSKGSVVSQAPISILNYPSEQLKMPPQGYILANTCFKVEGLTGLLAKKAVVNVKYSAADLDKAEGDASTLVLARWDESTGQWTILDTSLDKSSMTLSASTNQFGIWAVMVGKPQASIPWLPIVLGTVIVLILLVVILIKVVKPRRYSK
jgi:hypothetical protein